MYNRILVPTDGSNTATSGLGEAIKLTGNQESRIRLVHVVNELIVISPDASGVNFGRVIDALRSSGESLLKGGRIGGA